MEKQSSQLTTSMSSLRPTNWIKASSGAVKKYVNWLPAATISTLDTDEGFLGERSNAAASPLSEPWIFWKCSRTKLWVQILNSVIWK